jgi:phage baseplate assembly protein W
MAINSRKYTDIDLDFLPNPITKDILKKVDDHALAASVGNLLQTSHYERLFNPALGCNLKRYLFEQIDDITTNGIQEEIIRTIKNFETRVDLSDVTVTPDFDNNGYNITIKFFIRNEASPIVINFFLERVR